MGLQDVFFQLRLPFDSDEARALSADRREIYFHALSRPPASWRKNGPAPSFAETRAARGELQFDAWNVVPATASAGMRAARAHQAHGLRNSLLIAIAPTATIASIAGCYDASSRRSPTCSSAKRCRAISCRSTATWWRS
jgi:ribonucleoside-diphosphate reductase alpha chain